MTRTRRRWGRRREPGLLLLLLSATFSISLPLSLYFGCQLVLTFFPTGHQPPFSPGHFLFFFFISSFTLMVPLPRQSPAATPVREAVCLLVGRRRLPLGDCVALQLVRCSSANYTPGVSQNISTCSTLLSFTAFERDKSE